MTPSAEIQAAILKLAAERGPDKTICPSEVARHLGGPDEPAWRALMQPVRAEAVALAHDGKIEIKKGGQVVDHAMFTGIYRIAVAKD